MDPTVLAGMLFVLIILAMLGGFILLLPITRRLGLLLEERLTDRKRGMGSPEEIRELSTVVQSLRQRVEEIAERQEFTERLLAERHDPALPAPAEEERSRPSA